MEKISLFSYVVSYTHTFILFLCQDVHIVNITLLRPFYVGLFMFCVD